MSKNNEEFLCGDIHVHVQVQLLRVLLHASVLVLTGPITINVPLFKKLRDIIFLVGESLYEPFRGTF